MRMMIITGLLMLVAFSVSGQTSFRASVSNNPVAVDQRFRLSFELNTQGSGFTPPDLSDFFVLSGPNQSTSMQFINGNMSQSVTFSYLLQARSEGTFTIGSASVEANGERVTSAPIKVNVTKNTTSGSGSGGTAQSQQDQNSTNISSKNIFIRVVVNKTSAYVGEAIVATYKLYSNVQLVNYGINKVPSLNGFWTHDVELPSQLQLYNEVYNGVNYQVGDIKKVVLFPQQSGKLTLDPMEGECIARVRVKRNSSGGPFDAFNDPFFNDPFFGFGGVRDVKFAVKSLPLTINVNALPADAPPGFSGAVGNFTIDGSIDRNEVSANDALNYKVRIKGSGNIGLIDAPELSLSPDIERYDPKIRDDLRYGNEGASGSRTFEYLLIPRFQGEYEIPATGFVYFDPGRKRYVSLETQKQQIAVRKGAGGSAASVSGAAKSDFQLLNREIRFIKTSDPDLSTGNVIILRNTLYWISLILPLLLLAGITWFNRKRISEMANTTDFRSKKASRNARRRLKLAASLSKQGEEKKFHEEINRVLWQFISDKLRIPVSDLTKESVKKSLKNSGISDQLIAELVLMIEYCEMYSYAGSGSQKSMQDVHGEVVKLISAIENEYE